MADQQSIPFNDVAYAEALERQEQLERAIGKSKGNQGPDSGLAEMYLQQDLNRLSVRVAFMEEQRRAQGLPVGEDFKRAAAEGGPEPGSAAPEADPLPRP